MESAPEDARGRWGNRLHQVVLIASILPLSWLAMQAVHEFGHVLGAWLTGGTVARVVLHPLTISRTDLAENPHPLIVAWAGPGLGVLLPLLVLGVAWLVRLPGTYLWRFFTGFCLVANGCYIGVGSFDRIGDAGTLLNHGAAPWQLWAFGLATAPLGVFLWHHQGPHFGLGEGARPVQKPAAYLCLGLLVVVTVVECLVGGE